MNVRTAALVFFTFLFSFPTFSINNTVKLVGDCRNAVEIIPNGVYLFDKAPKGFGNIQEFKNNPKNSLYYFENETNSAWFTFEAPTSGEFTFKILPQNYNADFDFLLFEYTDENFCADLAKKKIKPIRSNISRFNPLEMSITGMAVSATQEFVHSGKGDHLSKSLHVEKGQRFYLVLNNVYGTKSKFRMIFGFYTTTTISGTVKDKDTGDIIGDATVTWEDKTGEVLAETRSDKITGKFKMQVPILKRNKPAEYVITAFKEDHFYSERKVFASAREVTTSINFVLPKLKKGLIRKQKNILFVTNQPVVLQSSLHSLKHLYKLMKKNPSLVIMIEGHTCGVWNEDGYTDQILSDWRTKAVKDFMIQKGISKKRIQTKGYGGRRMIHPYYSTPKQEQENRRVEIMVVSF